jgi:hypothetical protein
VSVERILRPTARDVDRVIARHRPVVFRGLMDGQPAAGWDLPGLRHRLGERRVQVVASGGPRVVWHPKHGLPLQHERFQDFADHLAVGRYDYLQDDINSVPALKADYRLPDCLGRRPIARQKLWLGGAGLVTPLHYDPVETFHWMVRGAKRFLCYRPGVGRYYPNPVDSDAPFISRVDPDDPRPGQFPRFPAAEAVELILEAGEVLYLPAFWWHQVYSREALNLSLNFVWFASPARNLRHMRQYLRARRHIARRRAAARAKEEAARAEQAGRPR